MDPLTPTLLAKLTKVPYCKIVVDDFVLFQALYGSGIKAKLHLDVLKALDRSVMIHDLVLLTPIEERYYTKSILEIAESRAVGLEDALKYLG